MLVPTASNELPSGKAPLCSGAFAGSSAMLNETILACFTTGLLDEKVRGVDSSRFQYLVVVPVIVLVLVGTDAANATLKDRDVLRDVDINADVARGWARERAKASMKMTVGMGDEFQPRIDNR